MKVFIVAYEFPFPANHGGKIDVWNRIRALKQEGVEIFLLTWHSSELREEDIATVKRMVSHLELIAIPKTFRRILRMIKYPSLVAARVLDKKMYKNILPHVKKFNPACIFIDGLYAGQTGLRFAKTLSLPVFFRSHNIEHKYMLGQYKMAYSFRDKLSILANLINLKKFEYTVVSAVDFYFDCSVDDVEFWKRNGFDHGCWLPFIFDNKPDSSALLSADLPRFDVGYIGNLYTPNNVEGVVWFIEKVLPLLTSVVPDIRIAIAGSNPADKLISVVGDNKNITLIANPPETEPIRKNCTVLINPLKFGSGVNVKSLEMIFSTKQVVSTSTGVIGIPKMVNKAFYIADSDKDFASAIINIIVHNKTRDPLAREELRKFYNGSSVKDLLTIINPASIHHLNPITCL